LSREESIPATRLHIQAVRTVRFWDALLAARTDANRFWMLLSGNAEVAFRQATTIIGCGPPYACYYCRSLLLQTLLLSSFEMPVLTTAATDNPAAAAAAATTTVIPSHSIPSAALLLLLLLLLRECCCWSEAQHVPSYKD
jgi:hypothetical protein